MSYIPADAALERFFGNDGEAGFVEGADELLVVEAILEGVIEQAAPNGVEDEIFEDLFGIEPAAWFEYAVYLGEAVAPIGDVMDDAEVKDRVVGSVFGVDFGGIADPEPDAVTAVFEVSGGAFDHAWVEVECVDGCGVEDVEDELGADAAAATDFEGAGTRCQATHFEQPAGLDVMLKPCADRVVHGGEFDPVEFQEHASVG